MSFKRVEFLLLIVASGLLSVFGLPFPLIGGYSAGLFVQENQGVKLINDHEFPYFVAVEFNDDQICGGSLIQPDLVLTAGHCVIGLDISKLKVRAGTYVYKGRNGHVRDAKAIKIHREFEFCAKRECDVALIKLKSNFTLTENIQIIKMAEEEQKTSLLGEKLTMLGLGEMKNGKLPSTLMAARVKVLSRNHCKKLLKKSLPKTYICTLGVNDNAGGCDGDSGGPLVRHVRGKPKEHVLIGIIAYVQLTKDGKCKPALPTAHSNVPLLRPWINQYLDDDAWIEQTEL